MGVTSNMRAGLPESVDRLVHDAGKSGGPVVFLTGAGISAESGIPTFRGKEGYWRVGSKNYHPMELATHAAFLQMPDEVWSWYLYRRGVCLRAEPNPAHRAIAGLDHAVGERLTLVTQNIDGLHRRAGSSVERTFQIHGDVDRMRCADECTLELRPFPDGVDVDWGKGRALGDVERALLRCEACGARTRPHVLWFDECYDEARFRFESSIAKAVEAELLVVIGTAGATNLPLQIGAIVARRGASMIVVNPEPSPFTRFAEQTPRGEFLEGTAGQWVPLLCERLGAVA